MIAPSPSAARALLARYASARIAHAESPGPRTAQDLADVTYTLCVLTGTRSVAEAIAAAELLLTRQAPQSARRAEPEAAGDTAQLPQ
ncbi:DUF5133 domain-containing protein [Streptomyces sp. SGAir0957]